MDWEKKGRQTASGFMSLQGCLTAEAPLIEKPTVPWFHTLASPLGPGRTGRGKRQLWPPPSSRGAGEAEQRSASPPPQAKWVRLGAWTRASLFMSVSSHHPPSLGPEGIACPAFLSAEPSSSHSFSRY